MGVAAPGADGVGAGGEGPAVALTEHGEDIGAVSDAVSAQVSGGGPG